MYSRCSIKAEGRKPNLRLGPAFLAWDPSQICVPVGQPLPTTPPPQLCPASNFLPCPQRSAPPPWVLPRPQPHPSVIAPPFRIRPAPWLTSLHGQHCDVVPAGRLSVQPLAGDDGTRVRIDIKDLVQIGVAVDGVPKRGRSGLIEGVLAPLEPVPMSLHPPPKEEPPAWETQEAETLSGRGRVEMDPSLHLSYTGFLTCDHGQRSTFLSLSFLSWVTGLIIFISRSL